MHRGFKSKAEVISEEWRGKLGIRIDGALPARLVADHMGIKVLGIEEIPGLADAHALHLLNGDSSGWSAFTVEADARKFIVHNVKHAPCRQESNIMHELAHIICRHPPGQIVQIGVLCLRHYNAAYEEEAVCLGSVLQVPRKALLWLCRDGLTVPELATRFGASEELVSYRLNTSGVKQQLVRERNRRKYFR